MADAYCDPKLHDGQQTPARFILKRGTHHYACCEDHLGFAVRWLLYPNRKGNFQVRTIGVKVRS